MASKLKPSPFGTRGDVEAEAPQSSRSMAPELPTLPCPVRTAQHVYRSLHRPRISRAYGMENYNRLNGTQSRQGLHDYDRFDGTQSRQNFRGYVPNDGARSMQTLREHSQPDGTHYRQNTGFSRRTADLEATSDPSRFHSVVTSPWMLWSTAVLAQISLLSIVAACAILFKDIALGRVSGSTVSWLVVSLIMFIAFAIVGVLAYLQRQKQDLTRVPSLDRNWILMENQNPYRPQSSRHNMGSSTAFDIPRESRQYHSPIREIPSREGGRTTTSEGHQLRETRLPANTQAQATGKPPQGLPDSMFITPLGPAQRSMRGVHGQSSEYNDQQQSTSFDEYTPHLTKDVPSPTPLRRHKRVNNLHNELQEDSLPIPGFRHPNNPFNTPVMSEDTPVIPVEDQSVFVIGSCSPAPSETMPVEEYQDTLEPVEEYQDTLDRLNKKYSYSPTYSTRKVAVHAPIPEPQVQPYPTNLDPQMAQDLNDLNSQMPLDLANFDPNPKLKGGPHLSPDELKALDDKQKRTYWDQRRKAFSTEVQATADAGLKDGSQIQSGMTPSYRGKHKKSGSDVGGDVAAAKGINPLSPYDLVGLETPKQVQSDVQLDDSMHSDGQSSFVFPAQSPMSPSAEYQMNESMQRSPMKSPPLWLEHPPEYQIDTSMHSIHRQMQRPVHSSTHEQLQHSINSPIHSPMVESRIQSHENLEGYAYSPESQKPRKKASTKPRSRADKHAVRGGVQGEPLVKFKPQREAPPPLSSYEEPQDLRSFSSSNKRKDPRSVPAYNARPALSSNSSNNERQDPRPVHSQIPRPAHAQVQSYKKQLDSRSVPSPQEQNMMTEGWVKDLSTKTVPKARRGDDVTNKPRERQNAPPESSGLQRIGNVGRQSDNTTTSGLMRGYGYDKTKPVTEQNFF